MKTFNSNKIKIKISWLKIELEVMKSEKCGRAKYLNDYEK